MAISQHIKDGTLTSFYFNVTVMDHLCNNSYTEHENIKDSQYTVNK